MSYRQQTNEQLQAEIDNLTAAMQTGSWERRAACTLQIQAILYELARRDQDKQNKVMVRCTVAITVMTVAITAMTGLQLWLAFRQAPAPPASTSTKSTSDPLQLFSKDDKGLHDCLIKVNPQDPLGLRSETPEQAAHRKACIQQYAH